MEFTAQQIAQFVQGRVEGDENATVNTFAKIEEGKEGAISFLSNPKYTHYVYETKSSIVLIDENVELRGRDTGRELCSRRLRQAWQHRALLPDRPGASYLSSRNAAYI